MQTDLDLQPIAHFQDHINTPLKSIITNDYICTSIGSSISIYHNQEFHTIDFDCEIEELVGLGTILVIGDQLGTIHIILLPNQVIYSQVVSEPLQKTFASILLTDVGCLELLIALTNGKIIRLQNIPKDVYTITENVQFMEILKENIEMSFVDTGLESITNVCAISHTQDVVNCDGEVPAPQYLICCDGEIPISVWTQVRDQGFVMVDSIDYITSSITQSVILNSILVLLDHSSNLYFVDLHTLILFKKISMPGLKEIGIATSPGCILGLFDDDIVQFHVSCFEIRGRVESIPKAAIVRGIGNMDRVVGQRGSTGFEIFEFTSRNPQKMLQKFVKQKDKKGALLFVKEAQLSIVDYYKGVLETHRNLELEEIEEAILHIDDPVYVAQFAYGFDQGDLDTLKKVLEITRRSVQKYNSEQASKIVSTGIVRLAAFRYLASKGWCETWNNDWHTFKESDMLLNIQTAIAHQDIRLGITLWRRHCQDDQLHKYMKELLYNIPPELNIETMLLILEEFRFSCNSLPNNEQIQLRRVLDEWVYETSEAIEQLLKKPKDASRLLEWAINCDETQKSTVSPRYQIEYWNSISESSKYKQGLFFEKMKTRKAVFRDMIDLLETHKFCISLSDYEKLTPSQIAIQLLERVHAPELLAENVMKHVEPFIRKHGLSLSNVLCEYCKEVMESNSSTSSVVNHWESRVLIIMDLVEDTSYRVIILLEAMRRTPVPWSSELDDQIQRSLLEANPKLKQDIEEQYKLMKLKLMVQKYGIRNFNVSDMNLASKLVPFILKHMEFSDAISDALQCLEAFHVGSKYEILVMRSQRLILSNELPRLDLLLQTGKESPEQDNDYFSEVNKEAVLKELDIWISLKLERVYQKRRNESDLLLFLEAGAIVLSTLTSINSQYHPQNRRYQRCLALYKDFSIRITPTLLDDNEFVTNELNKTLKDSLNQQNTEKLNVAFRVADLLGFDRAQLLWKTAHFLACQFHVEDTLTTCRELAEKFPTDSTANMIGDLIDLLLNQDSSRFMEHKNLSMLCTSLVDMARLAVRHCRTTELEYHLNNYKRLEMFKMIALKTDKGAYQEAFNQSNTEDPNLHLKSVFRNQYREIGLVMAAEKTIPMFLQFLGDLKKSEKAVVGKGKGKDNSSDFIQSGTELFHTCYSSRNYQCCLRILQLMLEHSLLKNISIPDGWAGLNSDAMLYMLQNIMSIVHLDYSFALGTILSLPKEKANSSFKNSVIAAGQDYEKLHRIAKVGAIAGSIWNQRTFQVSCMTLAQHAYWLQELTLLDIPFDEQLLKNNLDSHYHRTLVPYILAKSGGDLELTLSFASQFNIENDFIFSQFVLQELIVHSINGDDASTRFTRLEFPISSIANKGLFVEFLTKKCHTKLSPYDYEALLFVNQQILKIDPDVIQAKKNVLVLEMLMDYTRCTAPTEDESNNNMDPDHDIGLGNIDKTWTTSWSKNPFEVISAELSDEALPRLLPIGKVLNVPADQMYDTIIKKKVSLLQSQIKNRYQTNTRFGFLSFNDFKPLLTKIKDFQQAVSFCVFVGGNFPRGEDRIAAYKLALNFSQKWIVSLSQLETEENEKAKTGESKVKGLLNVAETEYGLQKHGLQILDKYVPKPSILLIQLLTKNPTYPSLPSDVYHSLAEDVSKRYGVDLDKLKLMLLQRWLSTDDEKESEVAIQERAIFLFHGKLEWGVQNLKAFAKQPTNKITTESRIRALSILSRMARLPAMEGTGIDPEPIERQLRLHMYLQDLEKIQMVQTPKEFEQCDKHSLARSIWLTKRSDHTGLRLICKLALDFEFNDYQLWNNVLQALYQKHDFSYLLDLILRLSSLALFSTLESIQELFEPVILGCCLRWLEENKMVQIDHIPQFFDYVQIGMASCYVGPQFVVQLQKQLVEWVIHPNVNPHRYLVAMAAIERTPSDESAVCILKIQQCLCVKDCLTILEEIEAISRKVPILSEVESYLNSGIYDLINEKQWFSEIAYSKFMSRFVRYLAENDKIHHLVNASVQLERYEDALKLVQIYCKFHSIEQSTEIEMIEKYSKRHPIENLELWKTFIENE